MSWPSIAVGGANPHPDLTVDPSGLNAGIEYQGPFGGVNTTFNDIAPQSAPGGRGPSFVDVCLSCPTVDCPAPAVGFVTELPPGRVQGDRPLVNISRPMREIDDEILRVIWRVFQDNTDVIAWSMCRVGFSQGSIDRLVRKLFGFDSFPVHIGIEDWFTNGEAQAWPSEGVLLASATHLGPHLMPTLVASGGLILVSSEPPSVWWQARWAWLNGEGSERQCAVLSAAALILHELGHIVSRRAHPAGIDCDLVNMLESTFLWAMLNRYAANRTWSPVPLQLGGAPAECCSGASEWGYCAQGQTTQCFSPSSWAQVNLLILDGRVPPEFARSG